MTLASGTRLGPYDTVAPLGRGGMGEVYRAHDPRLGRDVAVKLLPAAFSADADRLRRFEQEARAAGALNHPNILTVHEVGTHDGQPFIVAELLDGQTLRDALQHGTLPVKRAIDYAIQMCHGIGAAHEKGIVHRDLKPENVFVTKDCRIKILDFGLAKLTEAASGVAVDLANSPTLTSPAMMTGVGMILGTAAYMSPEQAKGRAADTRSDVWAFGCVLFEMLTARPLFAGETISDTLTAVLKETPDLTRVPARVRRLLHACLHKDPNSGCKRLVTRACC